MEKNRMSCAVIGIVATLLVVTVTASALPSHTPLYTVRMEQMSSEKNFLPTEVNSFTYTTESGVTLTYEVTAYCNAVKPLVSGGVETCETCPGHNTCPDTCPETCGEPSCWGTCFGNTCSTCTQPTCETCETCSTCPTSASTCSTCKPQETCWDTCEIDCL